MEHQATSLGTASCTLWIAMHSLGTAMHSLGIAMHSLGAAICILFDCFLAMLVKPRPEEDESESSQQLPQPVPSEDVSEGNTECMFSYIAQQLPQPVPIKDESESSGSTLAVGTYTMPREVIYGSGALPIGTSTGKLAARVATAATATAHSALAAAPAAALPATSGADADHHQHRHSVSGSARLCDGTTVETTQPTRAGSSSDEVQPQKEKGTDDSTAAFFATTGDADESIHQGGWGHGLGGGESVVQSKGHLGPSGPLDEGGAAGSSWTSRHFYIGDEVEDDDTVDDDPGNTDDEAVQQSSDASDFASTPENSPPAGEVEGQVAEDCATPVESSIPDRAQHPRHPATSVAKAEEGQREGDEGDEGEEGEGAEEEEVILLPSPSTSPSTTPTRKRTRRRRRKEQQDLMAKTQQAKGIVDSFALSTATMQYINGVAAKIMLEKGPGNSTALSDNKFKQPSGRPPDFPADAADLLTVARVKSIKSTQMLEEWVAAVMNSNDYRAWLCMQGAP